MASRQLANSYERTLRTAQRVDWPPSSSAGRTVGMFKEADSPTQGWEVYANRQTFHNDEGITLIADATAARLAGQAEGGRRAARELALLLGRGLRTSGRGQPARRLQRRGRHARHDRRHPRAPGDSRTHDRRDRPETPRAGRMTQPIFDLRGQDFSLRLGVSFLVLTLFIGLGASAAHLVGHHENRDGAPGLSLEDIEGSYHGVNVSSPAGRGAGTRTPRDAATGATRALARLARLRIASARTTTTSISETRRRPRCSTRPASGVTHVKATEGDGIGETIPLEYWDDVRNVAFSARGRRPWTRRSSSPRRTPTL